MIALSFLAFVGVAKAQQTLTVNDGTVTNNNVPIYGLYVDTQGQNSEFIIPASTEGMSAMIGGTINKLAFYISNSPQSWGSPTVQVYMGEVSGTTISSLNGPTGFTTVWQGTLSNQNATMEITLSTPYTYTGGNLLIGMYVTTASSTYKTTTFYGISAESGASRYNYGSGTGTAVSFLPKTTFSYTPGSGDPVVVESIEASDVTVYTGHTAQINYTVLPADAWYKQVSFASANNGIATVNQDGLVTAVAVGNTTVTITSTEYPAVSTTINVTVEYFPTLNEALNVNGGTLEFTNDATHPWTVEMEGDRIFAMSGNGGVSSSASTLTLVVNASEGDALSFDFKAWGEGTAKTIWDHCIFSVDGTEEFNYGAYDNDWETYNLVFTAGEHTLTWSFTKDGSVDGTGDYFAIDNVTYEPIMVIPVESITADDITMMTGETAQINPTVLPADANQAVTYASANTSIATVSEDGLVTAVAAGTTTITITSVSTPEVSTTINVTVNSNPDNVVFTVNAPANARPGDVITVEAYLNAPTSGNYNGFTGLVLGLHFDTEAFEPYGNPVKGPVAETSTMSMPALPNESHPDLVQMGCVMPVGTPNPTTGLVFSMQFTVLAETGSYDFYAEPTWASEEVSNFVCRLSMDEAAVNIPYEVTPSTVAVGVITLDITGYGESDGGYYLIASPIGEVSPTDVGSMLDNEYDLYYFDQAQDLEWINYEGPDGNFSLQPGKGYLYANQEDVTLTFTGTPYSGDGTVELVYDNNAVDFKGWNLVGNPFNEIAYLADGRDFYVMQSEGSEIIAGEVDAINPMQGIFVIAEEDGETVTFTTEQPNKKIARLALNLINGRSVIDRAIVRFGEGRQLPKFQISRNSTKVYIPMDGSDFAVVRSQGVGEIPVNFKAEKSGSYSLSFSTENVEMAYLHLIDNLTGKDVDLLSTSSYSFEASSSDYESRFKLVFATGHNDGETFAYFNNGSFVINNEGEAILQVVDVTGRILSNETISGSISKNIQAAPGVYMLRMVKGSDVKVQKIVVE